MSGLPEAVARAARERLDAPLLQVVDRCYEPPRGPRG
jgi:hypothetical protein